MSLKQLFGAIAKVEDQEDGTIKVWGVASSESEDLDGEIIKASAIKAAIPEYMKFGAVREMHQAKAAGTALEIDVGDDGVTNFCAHVVDTEAVKKVKAGVYKGFSIGGKVSERDQLNKTVITGITLVEVSLVDRPANPDAVITCYKADGIDIGPEPASAIDQIAEALNKGEITAERLLELVKGGAKADDTTEKAAGADDLRKSMWGVSNFADLLCSIAYLVSDAQYEAEWEGDGSPVPAALKDWLKAGAEIFKQMATEEIDEMLATYTKAASNGDLVKSLGIDITKAGARYSKSTKAALGEIHKSMKECDAKLAALGYEDAEEDEDDADKVAKALVVSTDAIAKAFGMDGATTDEIITKAADLFKKNASLTARVIELEALPAPGKALLKAVSKGVDVSADDDKTTEPEPLKKSDGSTSEVAGMIKYLHQHGGRIG